MAEMQRNRRAPIQHKFRWHSGEFVPKKPLRRRKDIKERHIIVGHVLTHYSTAETKAAIPGNG
jgi:hypothetical protein